MAIITICSNPIPSILQGSFSCMLYDTSVQYLLVWRSGIANKLYWGLDDANSNLLLIASVKANLTEFPAGCAFEVCSHPIVQLSSSSCTSFLVWIGVISVLRKSLF